MYLLDKPQISLKLKLSDAFSNTQDIKPELAVRIYLKFKSWGYGFKKPTIFFASEIIGAAIALAFKAPS